MKDGESYAISGLLDRRASDNLSKTPGIASVLILGEIFKSKNLNHSTAELVVVVTVSIVDPLKETKAVEMPVEPLPHFDTEDFDKGLGPSKAMEKTHE